MKTRITSFLDTADMTPLFGLQINRGKGWAHAVQDGKLFLVKTKAEVEAKRREVKDLAKLKAKLTATPN